MENETIIPRCCAGGCADHGTGNYFKGLPPVATGPTVLAVDDDPVLVEAMYAVLSAAGYNVLTSTRGTKGVELLQHTGAVVDVVVLDYQMPVTIAQLLPSMRRLAPMAKVLGISAADPDDLLPEFRNGMDKLLRKPFTKTDLISAVAALLPAAMRGIDQPLEIGVTRGNQTL